MVSNHNRSINAERIAGALKKSRSAGHGRYVACCPAHDDKTPSLSIRDAGDKVLVRCHAGCSQDEVIGALREMGLWHKPSHGRLKYLKNQSHQNEFRRNKTLLAIAAAQASQGYVHTEFERAQIKRAIRILESGPRFINTKGA
jgi:hypothetical protein